MYSLPKASGVPVYPAIVDCAGGSWCLRGARRKVGQHCAGGGGENRCRVCCVSLRWYAVYSYRKRRWYNLWSVLVRQVHGVEVETVTSSADDFLIWRAKAVSGSA